MIIQKFKIILGNLIIILLSIHLFIQFFLHSAIKKFLNTFYLPIF